VAPKRQLIINEQLEEKDKKLVMEDLKQVYKAINKKWDMKTCCLSRKNASHIGNSKSYSTI